MFGIFGRPGIFLVILKGFFWFSIFWDVGFYWSGFAGFISGGVGFSWLLFFWGFWFGLFWLLFCLGFFEGFEFFCVLLFFPCSFFPCFFSPVPFSAWLLLFLSFEIYFWFTLIHFLFLQLGGVLLFEAV